MLKDILVHVDGSPAATRRVAIAAQIAEGAEAHLTGLHITSVQDHLAFADGYAVQPMLQFAHEYAEAETFRATNAFRDGTAGRAVRTEWRVAEGLVDRTLARQARLADLVVVGQNDPANPPLGSAALVPETVPLTAGRPTLIVPYAGTVKILGSRVLVAWDGSRESARAVNDALPLLRQAQLVVVTSAERPGQSPGEVPTAAIATHLSRHGVTVEARADAASGISIADMLLSLAADISADLLVMGSYGHSRLRELVMGGVTRDILDRMTLPVLMSH